MFRRAPQQRTLTIVATFLAVPGADGPCQISASTNGDVNFAEGLCAIAAIAAKVIADRPFHEHAAHCRAFGNQVADALEQAKARREASA